MPRVPGPTAALLWAACRPEPHDVGVRDAIRDGADLERAVAAALTQRVAPLLWRGLRASGADESAHPSLAPIDADAARCRAHAQLVLPRLAEHALAPLTGAGLEPLVLKGAALVDRYPAPGLRPMDDVDVLLPRAHIARAVGVLRSAGWRTVDVPGRHYEIVLVHDLVPGLPLELHRSLSTWDERSNRLSDRALWDRRIPREIAGVRAFGLDVEDELLVLACHAAKPFHVFGRLLWSVDLAVVVSSAAAAGRPVDWDRVAAWAAVARCRTALAVGLVQADRLGVPSPVELRRLAATGARRAALEPVCSPDWPIIERDDGIRNRLRYALVDDRRLQARLLVTSLRGKGPVRAARAGIGLGARAVRRWRQLRGDTRSPIVGVGSSEHLGHVLHP